MVGINRSRRRRLCHQPPAGAYRLAQGAGAVVAARHRRAGMRLSMTLAITDSVGDIAQDLLRLPAGRFRTVLADPPWRFDNASGKVAPEHQRLRRYRTMTLDEIMVLTVERIAAPTAHLYLWVPNALLPDG